MLYKLSRIATGICTYSREPAN